MVVLLRRWPIVLLGLLISLGLTAWVFMRTAPVYQSTAQALLLPPSVLVPLPSGEQEVRSNPYLELTYSVSATADVMATVLTAREMKDRLAAEGATGEFVISPASPGSAVLLIDARDESPVVATGTSTAVLDALTTELQERQVRAGAAPSRFVTISIVEAPTPAQQQLGSRLRTAGATFLLGVVATVLVAFATDALRRRRPDMTDEVEKGSEDAGVEVQRT